LKTKETELESRQIILPRFEQADATVATATPRPSSASLAGNRRVGGGGEAKFSCPQTLEKARNRERTWLAVGVRAGLSFQGMAASDSSGFTPSGSA